MEDNGTDGLLCRKNSPQELFKGKDVNYMISIAMDNTSKLYQYDINRRVIISGLPPEGVYQIHFKKYMKDSDVIVKEGEFDADNNISAQIPNSLLTNSNMISVYVYGTIGTVTKTFHTENLLIIPRPKPEGYVLPDDEDSVNTYNKLVNEINSLKNDKVDKNELTDTVGKVIADELAENVIPKINNKVDKVEGKGLSANDFTDDYKERVNNTVEEARVAYSVGEIQDEYLEIPTVETTKGLINPTPITEIPTTLEPNKAYNFGFVDNLSLSFPTYAQDGDVIYITFFAEADEGKSPNLIIDTTNTCDVELIPENSTGYEIFAKYNGSLVNFGVNNLWIVNYSEYQL